MLVKLSHPRFTMICCVWDAGWATPPPPRSGVTSSWVGSEWVAHYCESLGLSRPLTLTFRVVVVVVLLVLVGGEGLGPLPVWPGGETEVWCPPPASTPGGPEERGPCYLRLFHTWMYYDWPPPRTDHLDWLVISAGLHRDQWCTRTSREAWQTSRAFRWLVPVEDDYYH